ncbi:MAG TPA: undecaprenyl-diphosphate phosphatase [Baekduia sp.]|nr:undecaprenyl-diphosphate phosphatase [Baekduia sp.]
MDAFQAIVLGIVQGLTEFLPISSTAHLRLVPAFAGWDDPGTAFTAVVQLGTMAAVLLYFRHDLWNIARAWLRSLRDPDARTTLEARLGWFLIVGTIPISILGLAFKDKIETDARQLVLIGIALIVLGLILELAEKVGRKDRDIASLTMRDGVLIGVAQAAALVPGVSRSGSTISAGLFLGLPRSGGALLVPAQRSGRRPVRALRAQGRRRRRRRGRGPDDHRHHLRVHRRLRVDRVVVEVPDASPGDGLRRLPRGARRRRPRAGRGRRAGRVTSSGPAGSSRPAPPARAPRTG